MNRHFPQLQREYIGIFQTPKTLKKLVIENDDQLMLLCCLCSSMKNTAIHRTILNMIGNLGKSYSE